MGRRETSNERVERESPAHQMSYSVGRLIGGWMCVSCEIHGIGDVSYLCNRCKCVYCVKCWGINGCTDLLCFAYQQLRDAK